MSTEDNFLLQYYRSIKESMNTLIMTIEQIVDEYESEISDDEFIFLSDFSEMLASRMHDIEYFSEETEDEVFEN